MSSYLTFKKVTPKGAVTLASFSRNSELYGLFHYTETAARLTQTNIDEALAELGERIKGCNRYIENCDEVFLQLTNVDDLWENRNDKKSMQEHLEELKESCVYLRFINLMLNETDFEDENYLTWEMD